MSCRRSVFTALVALALSGLPVSLLEAQATYGDITGVVTDPSGAVIPNAAVTVRNQDTGFTRSVTSNSRGEYEVTHLNTGTYTVAAEAPGFRRFEHRDLVLESVQTARVDVALEVGTANAQVQVTAGTPVIETDSPTLSDSKTARELRDLPLNTLNTVLLNDFLFFTPTGYQAAGSTFVMGGARGTELYYNIDGVSANAPLYGVQDSPLEPSVESIAEMKFNLVNNKAEFPLATNVVAITKSGQNELHGRLFEQNTFTQLTARQFFAASVGQNLINDFGGSIGGPIKHNKAFFFGTYEGFRQRIPAVQAPNLPSTLMRTGDFSQLLAASSPITIKNPYSNLPFPGNVIPASMLDGAAQKWQQRFFPQPNFGPPNLVTANFRATFPQQTQQDKMDLRGDYYLSSQHTMYWRYSYTRLHPHAIDAGVPPSLAGYRWNIRIGHLAAFSDTWTISPRLVNEFKLGFTRAANPRGGDLTGQSLIDELGIQGIPRQPDNLRNIPNVNISNFQTIVQVAGEYPAETQSQAIDQLTYIRGGHTLKTGFEYRPQQADDYVLPSFGTYNFTNRFTGYSYSDFLLGLPQTTSYAYPGPSIDGRYYYLSGFAQDDWKVSSRLTLSYGLRYEYDSPVEDKHNTISNFDPQTGQIVVPNQTAIARVQPLFLLSQIPIVTAAQAGFPGRALRTSDKTGWQPRLGFAYRPFSGNKTVVRGGYGIYYDALGGALGMSTTPFGQTATFTNSITNGQPLLTFENPLLGPASTGSVTFNSINSHLHNPRLQQWNMTVERSLSSNIGLRVSYLGSIATGLTYARNINQPVASTIPFVQSRRPYPLINNITFYDNGGTQTYHSLSTLVNRRMSGGLSFEGSWTWAKCLADADELGSTEGGPTIQNTYNRVVERGNCEYIARHRIFATSVWEIPVGRGRLFLNRPGISDWVLGGWQLSATYDWQLGDYLTPSFSGADPSNTNTIGGVPDCIGNPVVSSPSITHYFNVAAFATPPNGRFGNCGHGILLGPSRQAANLGMFKSFRVTEKMSLRLQATFTNVLNHPNFNDPNVNISAPASFGTITSVQTRDYSGPRTGLLAAFLSF